MSLKKTKNQIIKWYSVDIDNQENMGIPKVDKDILVLFDFEGVRIIKHCVFVFPDGLKIFDSNLQTCVPYTGGPYDVIQWAYINLPNETEEENKE